MISTTLGRLKATVHTIFSTIVWNDSQGRARALWRIVLPLIPLLVFAAAFAALLVELALPIPALTSVFS